MKFSVSFPDELAGRLDAARGDVSRSLWLRRAVEQTLGEPFAMDPVAEVPAPAEQLVEQLRGRGTPSALVRRSGPIPKR